MFMCVYVAMYVYSSMYVRIAKLSVANGLQVVVVDYGGLTQMSIPQYLCVSASTVDATAAVDAAGVVFHICQPTGS